MLKARLSDFDRQRGMSFEEIGKRYDMSPSTPRQYADAFRKSSDKVVGLVESDKLGSSLRPK